MKTILIVVLCIFMSACSNSNVQPKMPNSGPFYSHTISQQGETLASIARWYTGSSSNWTAIQSANPDLKPNKMRVGTVINIPQSMVTRTDPMPRHVVTAKTQATETEKAAEEASTTTTEDTTTAAVAATEQASNTITESAPPSMDAPTTEAKTITDTPSQVADNTTVTPDASNDFIPSPNESGKAAPSVTSILGAFGKALVAPDTTKPEQPQGQ